MKRQPVITIILIMILFVMCMQSTCYAQNMLRKLGRGTANIFTSPFELPRSIQQILYDNGPVAGLTYGIVDGAFKTLLRAVVGVYEVVTFPIPFPAEYKPVVEPEFLFEPDGAYSF